MQASCSWLVSECLGFVNSCLPISDFLITCIVWGLHWCWSNWVPHWETGLKFRFLALTSNRDCCGYLKARIGYLSVCLSSINQSIKALKSLLSLPWLMWDTEQTSRNKSGWTQLYFTMCRILIVLNTNLYFLVPQVISVLLYACGNLMTNPMMDAIPETNKPHIGL